jgi:predicted XRE-type DNA-binding protein
MDPVVAFKRHLMRQISRRIRDAFPTKSEAARYLGVVQPTVTYISRLNHQRFALEYLIRVAVKLGLRVHCRVLVGAFPED